MQVNSKRDDPGKKERGNELKAEKVTHACTRVSARICMRACTHERTGARNIHAHRAALSSLVYHPRRPEIPPSPRLARSEATAQFIPNYILITVMASTQAQMVSRG